MAAGINSFQRLSQEISNNIYKISNNVAQLQSLQKQLIAGSSEANLKSKFNDLQRHTHQLATDTSSNLKELSNYKGSDIDQRTHKFQKERLLSEFAKILNTFQGIQRQEKEFEKNVISARASNFFDDGGQTSANQGLGYRQDQAVMQIDASELDMEIMRERDDALVKLESDITDVNQIFKELSVLVHEQGEVIDTIEDNVVSAATNVEEGTEQLRKARSHQARSRKTKCIIISIILVVILIIVIVLAVHFRQ